MRVLEPPKTARSSPPVRCPACEARLEVEGADLVGVWSDADGPGRPGSWSYVAQCPVEGCGHTLTVAASGVPPLVLNRAQARARAPFSALFQR